MMNTLPWCRFLISFGLNCADGQNTFSCQIFAACATFGVISASLHQTARGQLVAAALTFHWLSG